MNLKAVSKWDAWNTLKGTSTHDSEVEYISNSVRKLTKKI